MASLFTFGEEGAELQGGLVMIRVALTEVASQHDGVTGEQSIAEMLIIWSGSCQDSGTSCIRTMMST